MLNDPLANALSLLNNHDRAGRKECLLHPATSLLHHVMRILHEQGFVGAAEQVTDARGGVFKINLLGNINACGVIKPRFAVSVHEYEKFEKRFLPAKGMGVLLVSTSNGVMTHDVAKEKKLGGRLIAYCY